MSAITVGEDLVHYEVLGRGRPVILVHGWLGSWRYWIPTMQHLHMRYRVYAVDLFGYGDSGKNAQQYSIQNQVKMLEDFMDQLYIPRAAFIGHGLGAMVVAEFAFQYQQLRVPRAMLISTPLFDVGNLSTRTPKRLSQSRKRAAEDRDKTIVSSSLEATIPSASMMKQAMMERERAANRNRARLLRRDDDPTDESMERNLLEQSIGKINLGLMLDRCFKRTEVEYEKLAADIEGTDDRVLYKSVYEYNAPRMLDTVNQLDMPTLLVHGQDDPLIDYPPEPVWDYVTRGEDDVSNIYYLPLEGVRHFPMLENERFGRFVLDFLETRDLSSLEGIKGRWRRRSR